MTTFATMPLRYSADPAAMIRFLTDLGMARVVTAGADNFATLVAGGGGRVMVHSVQGADATVTAGETVLCFATEDSDEAAAHLDGKGVAVDVWDESYGRQAMATTPSGGAVWINEEMADLYGYEGHEAAPDRNLVVAAIPRLRTSTPTAPSSSSSGSRRIPAQTSGGRACAARAGSSGCIDPRRAGRP